MNESPTNPLAVGIVGGGAAGMSCALWLKHLGYTPHIIEHNAKPGGQLLALNRINRWVLGSPDKTSAELAGLYAAHISRESVSIQCNASLTAVKAGQAGYDLLIEEPGQAANPLSVRALVIATGVRILAHEVFAGIPGFQPLCDEGLISFFPVGHVDKLAEVPGKTVAVIGGGDNAYYTAKDVALAGARTYLLIRSRPKARNAVQKEVGTLIGQGLITARNGTRVSAFRRHQGGIEIALQGPEAAIERINVDLVFARTGYAANTEFLDAFEAFSGIAKQAGYLITDPAKRTSIPWVYAIGDVANPKHQSVVGAIADGAIAAQDLSERG